MKIAAISDIHIGDARRTEEFEEQKLEILSDELNLMRADIILNVGDSVSLEKYLRKNTATEKCWQKYLKFKDSIKSRILEVCLNREIPFFADIFKTENYYYSMIENNVLFISISPEYDNDHTLSEKQLAWLENKIKSNKGKIMFFLSHVPVEQSTDRLPGKEIYLTDSKIIKDWAAGLARFSVFSGGHFHKIPPPKLEKNYIMMMAGFIDALSSPANSMHIRQINLEDDFIEIDTITVEVPSHSKKIKNELKLSF